MNLIFAATVGVLFGSGVYLVLKPDLFRVIVGLVLISNAASLAVMASGLTRGVAAIAPDAGEMVSDPLTQALTLTALVIGFAVTALLMALVVSVYRSRRSVDLDDLSRAEAEEDVAAEALRIAPEEQDDPTHRHDPDEVPA